MVAVLGGVIGEATISLHLQSFLHEYTTAEWVEPASSWIAFFLVTTTFVLLADLIPKRLALINPEGVAFTDYWHYASLYFFLKPIVWFFDGLSNIFFHLMGGIH